MWLARPMMSGVVTCNTHGALRIWRKTTYEWNGEKHRKLIVGFYVYKAAS